MKSRISKALLPLLITLLLVFSACSASYVPKDTNVNRNDGNEQVIGEDGTENNTDIEEAVRKVIKNGKIDVETDDVSRTYADILAFAADNGGYEYSHQKSVNDSYTSIKAVIKIVPDKLDALMSYIGNISEVINSSTNSDDITEKYYDAQTRITTKKKTLENYYKYLEEAKSVDETLTLQKAIDELTEEIEVLEGKLRLWDSMSSEATLTLTISQQNDPLRPKKEVNWNALTWSDMGILMKNGFITVLNFIVSAFQWFVIAIASISPVLLIAAAIIVIVKVRNNINKKKTWNGDNNDNK